MMTLATGNRHKLEEFRELLDIPLQGLREVPGAPEPEETGATFEENAWIKAASLAAHTGGWALADDSGLEVETLDGAPGVHSARFAGRHGDDKANNQLLLEKLKTATNRRARFVCALAVCGPDGNGFTVRGICSGNIAEEPRGTEGFGYDPLFVPDGETLTFAELGPSVKQKLSHRASAIALLKARHPDCLTRLAAS